MGVAPSRPRREDDSGSSPAFSRIYRVIVEEFDGSNREHQFAAEQRQLGIGEVLAAGQEGWPGPTVAIDEIDHHPDAVQAGIAHAHPALGRR
jgi:hypothetical protein